VGSFGTGYGSVAVSCRQLSKYQAVYEIYVMEVFVEMEV
jgi:hypothetical protein